MQLARSTSTCRSQTLLGQPDPAPPSLSITIVPQAPPTITPFTLPNGTVNVAYPATQLAATGGIQPYTWSVNPPLPNGLSFSPSGLISGIPLDGSNGTGAISLESLIRHSQLDNLAI